MIGLEILEVLHDDRQVLQANADGRCYENKINTGEIRIMSDDFNFTGLWVEKSIEFIILTFFVLTVFKFCDSSIFPYIQLQTNHKVTVNNILCGNFIEKTPAGPADFIFTSKSFFDYSRFYSSIQMSIYLNFHTFGRFELRLCHIKSSADLSRAFIINSFESSWQ